MRMPTRFLGDDAVRQGEVYVCVLAPPAAGSTVPSARPGLGNGNAPEPSGSGASQIGRLGSGGDEPRDQPFAAITSSISFLIVSARSGLKPTCTDLIRPSGPTTTVAGMPVKP